MIKNRNSRNLVNYLMVFLILISSSLFAQMPAAGTVIKNQASATYTDSSGLQQTTTSNLVETVVQQVGAFRLDQDQSEYAIPGQVVSFPHVLTNEGNGFDSFTLDATNSILADDYDFTGFNIYPDVNQDGVADSNVPITDTGILAAGEAFYFIVAASVPYGLTDQDSGKITVTATSIDSSLYTPGDETQTNTDDAILSEYAVIRVTKSISTASGAAGSGPYTVTLTYSNPSTLDATDVKLSDALPQWMNYVAGSGQWSVTGTTPLTDAVDVETADPGVLFCAYDAACGSGSEVVGTVATVASGESGTISFSVELDAGAPVSTLVNTANFEYNNGNEVVPTQNTNSVPVDIIPQPGVVANGSTISDVDGTDEAVVQPTAAIGSTVAFDNVIWNTGNSTDSYDISIDTAGATYPPGTTFSLFKSDGFTPLIDNDDSGEVDTGPIESGEFYVVVLKARIPMTPTAAGTAGYDVTKTATSANDPSLSNPVTDHLDVITGSEVDLTNAAPVASGTATGVGAGPLAAPQTELTIESGNSDVFTLFVNNTGGVADSFNISYSKDDPFVEGTLPSGWTVGFYNDGGNGDCSSLGAASNNTSIILPGAEKLVCAKVLIAANAGFVSGSQSIYFKVESVLTGASDIKHDAVIMAASEKLILEPDSNATVEPGSSVVYEHRLTNTGNTTYTNLSLSSTDTLAADGWASVLYEDTDGDGVLTGADQPVSSLAPFSLDPDETKIIFAKVFSPATAPFGTENITNIEATGETDTGSIVNTTVNAKDITKVAATSMAIAKRQAPDADCNGVPDSAFGFDMFQAQPNTCVMYDLTATNTSSSTSHNVRIDDVIPAFTSHFTNAGALPTINQGGTITQQPAEGGTGIVAGEVISVAGGDSVTLIFGVRVE